jgi:hypothetical protein
MRSHLKVYFDFEVKAKEYSDEEKGRLLLAMLRYAKDGTEETLTGNERFVFPVFKAQIDEDIKAYDTKVANGSRGGRPVRNMEPEETEDNLKKPKITENNLNEPEESEICKKEERRKKKEERRDIYFDRFWDSYPRKEAKQTAKKAFEKLNPDESLLQTMLEAVERFKGSAQWREENGRFIPHPATWINQRRWEDEVKGGTGDAGYRRSCQEPDGKIRSAYSFLDAEL